MHMEAENIPGVAKIGIQQAFSSDLPNNAEGVYNRQEEEEIEKGL